MKTKAKAKSLVKKVTKALTPILDLPFAERIPLFDAEYKKLSAKYGIFHNPINIYDDLTTPGGVLAPKAVENKPVAPVKL